jgi:uncharacterized membrane protein
VIKFLDRHPSIGGGLFGLLFAVLMVEGFFK